MPRKYTPTEIYSKILGLIGNPVKVERNVPEFEPSIDLNNHYINFNLDYFYEKYYYPGLGFNDKDKFNSCTDYSVSDAEKGIKNVLKNIDTYQIMDDIPDEIDNEGYAKNKPLRPLPNIIEIKNRYMVITKAIFDRILDQGLKNTDVAFLDQEELMEHDTYKANEKKINELYSLFTLDKMLEIYASNVKQEDLLYEANQIAFRAPTLNKKGYMIDPQKADDQNLEQALDAYNAISNIRKKRGFFWKAFHPFKNHDEKKALKSIENSLKCYGVTEETMALAREANLNNLNAAKEVAKTELNDLYVQSAQYNNFVLNAKERLIDRDLHANRIIEQQQQELLQDNLAFDNCIINNNITGSKEVRENEIQTVKTNLASAIEIYNKYQSANRARQEGDLTKLSGLSTADLAEACSKMENKFFGFLSLENINDLRNGKKVNVDKIVRSNFEKMDQQMSKEASLDNEPELSDDVLDMMNEPEI